VSSDHDPSPTTCTAVTTAIQDSLNRTCNKQLHNTLITLSSSSMACDLSKKFYNQCITKLKLWTMA